MPTFLVMAHEHPAQVARLAARLGPHPVIVHINARVDQVPFEHATAHLAHVSFVRPEQRQNVNWAGPSLTRAIKVLMTAGVSVTAPDDHLVLLSGADYPIRPVDQFVQYLRDTPFRQHLRYFAVETSSDKYRRCIERRNYRDVTLWPNAPRGSLRAKSNEAFKRSLAALMAWHKPDPCPAGLIPMRGSLWTALTAEAAADALARTTAQVDRWFARTFCPDEMYLHTMLASGPFAAQCPVGGPEPFPGPRPSLIANFHVIDDTLDKWFTVADLDLVLASDKWFVRKVRPQASDELLDRLDAAANAVI